jgi:putative CRISPR-associated protein (TIGR02620 family)
MKTLVVTRHQGMVDFLREEGHITEGNFEVVAHVSPEEVEGREVIGVLPLHLASLCRRVGMVPLNLPPELRGVELTSEQVREHAEAFAWFEVSRLTPR